MIQILAGSASLSLSKLSLVVLLLMAYVYVSIQKIANYMQIELGEMTMTRYADGEVLVEIQEEAIRGCDVYIVQSICPPANENLIELLMMINACHLASAKNVTAAIPYFAYARTDRKEYESTARLVAKLIAEAGANRMIACDFFLEQVMQRFDIPVDLVQKF